MVEVRGIEPLSERTTTEASPSAAYTLDLTLRTPTGRIPLGQSPKFSLELGDNYSRVAWYYDLLALTPGTEGKR